MSHESVLRAGTDAVSCSFVLFVGALRVSLALGSDSLMVERWSKPFCGSTGESVVVDADI